MAAAVPVSAPAADVGGPSLYGVVDVLRPDRIAGWVIDRRDSAAALDVEIGREGRVVATVKAARPRRDLERAGVGTGRYGFACDLDPPLEPGFEFTVTATARAGDGTAEELHRPASRTTADPDRRLLERIFEELRRADPAPGTPADLRETLQRIELAQARIETVLAALEIPPPAASHTGLRIVTAIAITMAAASLAIGIASMWLP